MFKIGDSYITKKTVFDSTIKEIANISGDINPIHLDDEYAKATVFGRRIAHGLFCLNEISAILGNFFPGPGTILLSENFKYKNPVFIGDRITTKIEVIEMLKGKDIYILSVECKNQNNDMVLDGFTEVKYKMKSLKLSSFMDMINGKLVSDGNFQTLEYCTSNCDNKFLSFLEAPKFLKQLNPHISCVITKEEMVSMLPEYISGIIVAEEPKLEFVKLHNFLADSYDYGRPSFPTVIGNQCDISPLAYIADKNVRIGDNVTIAPFTVINENVEVGDNCIIHENCVLGGKSFNFVKTRNGQVLGMKDLGRVIIKENVEICPLCHIAGCPLPTDVTEVGQNVKFDSMVHVGHGTKIGKRTEIPAGAKIAGNCIIGEDVWIGVNSTISNRIKIGDNGRVSLGSVVTKDVEDGQTVTGNFAIEHRQFIRDLKEKRAITIDSEPK